MTLRQTLSLLPAIALLLPACLPTLHQQAFYTSPFNGFANDYHPLPRITDSAHTAVYAQGTFLIGGANDQGTDNITGFRTSLTVAHHGKYLQAFYGGDLSVGNYQMGSWDSSTHTSRQLVYPPINYTILNEHSGGKFFGGAGFHGGLNAVIPINGGEWRILGLETTLHQEFGDYLDLRRKLPDSAAAFIARNPFFATLAVSSEWVGYTSKGEIGFRLAMGRPLGSPYSNPNIYDSVAHKYLHYAYYSFSFHLTSGKYGCYMQFTGATKALSVDIGLHYRLGRPRNPSLPPRRSWFHLIE